MRTGDGQIFEHYKEKFNGDLYKTTHAIPDIYDNIVSTILFKNKLGVWYQS